MPLTGPRVVKTAHLALVTPRDGFSSAFQQASLVASRYGGFVQSSSTGGTESRRGSLLIRVPAASFESALADLRGLGRIDREETAGEDVTARYVDLGSRLRAWEAEEAALIALLRKATTVDATLRVRRELQEVQGNIEQLKGQLRLIEDQTDLASIAVDLREAGLPAVQAKAEADGPSFTSAWKATRDGFLGVIFTMLVGLGYLVPIGIVVMALALLWRWTRPHRLRRVGAGGFEPPTSAL